jgi:hypothetical protein
MKPEIQGMSALEHVVYTRLTESIRVVVSPPNTHLSRRHLLFSAHCHPLTHSLYPPTSVLIYDHGGDRN